MTGKIAKSVTGKIHFWPIYHFNKFVFDLFICNLFPPNDLFASRSPTFHTEKIEQLHLFLLQWQGWVKRRVSVIAGSQQMTSPGREGHWLPPSLELPWQTQERNCPTEVGSLPWLPPALLPPVPHYLLQKLRYLKKQNTMIHLNCSFSLWLGWWSLNTPSC